MADIDPVILVAAVTCAALGIATVVLCRKTTEPNTELSEPAPKPKKKSKSSSKSKSSKSSSGNSSGKEIKSSTEALQKVEEKPKSKPKKLPASVPEPAIKFKDAPEEQAEVNSDMIFASSEALKKSKKAKETQEQRTARLEKQKAAKAAKKMEEEAAAAKASNVIQQNSTVVAGPVDSNGGASASTSNPPPFDGWAVVEDKRKLKVKKSESSGDEDIPALLASSADDGVEAPTPATAPVMVVEEAPAAPAAPVIETITSSLTVEAKKLGLLIGPKGVTKIGLQTATNTEISMPKVERDFTGPVDISVTGSHEGVQRAIHAMNEMCTKGYCNLLAGADFYEGYVAVPPKSLPDIIGKGGSCIKAIQLHTGVKINTPSNFTRTTPGGETIVPSKVKINLAGSRDKVAEARNLILDLTKYYHTPVTHPGVVHIEMDIPSQYYNYIIGSKGSEIKHIQANYKVTVHVPGVDSIHENVLIVGAEEAVDLAEKHILKIKEKVDVQVAERAKAEAEGIALGENAKAKYAAQQQEQQQQQQQQGQASTASAPSSSSSGGGGGGGGGNRVGGGGMQENSRPARVDKADEPQEEWMQEFAPRKAPINIGAMLPSTAKFAPDATTTTTAPAAAAAGDPSAASTDGATPAEAAAAAAASNGSTGVGPTAGADATTSTGTATATTTSTPAGTTGAWGGMGALPAETW